MQTNKHYRKGDFVKTRKIMTADRCEFTAVGSITEPIAEEYKVSGAAVYEDGKWLLEDLGVLV